MKFGQLIEYKMKNIFLKNHVENVVEKLVPYPFIKKIKTGSTIWNVIQFVLIVYVQVKVYQNMITQKSWPHAFTLCKAFLKSKRSRTSLPALFLHDFF